MPCKLQPQDVVKPSFCHVSKSSSPVVTEITRSHLLGTGGYNLSSGISSCISKSDVVVPESAVCVDKYEMGGIQKVIWVTFGEFRRGSRRWPVV